jgi:hypothetical protein
MHAHAQPQMRRQTSAYTTVCEFAGMERACFLGTAHLEMLRWQSRCVASFGRSQPFGGSIQVPGFGCLCGPHLCTPAFVCAISVRLRARAPLGLWACVLAWDLRFS